MSVELDFFDSNILIASSVFGHPHHYASRRLLERLQGGGACASHSLAEAFNNLTRTKRGYALPPSDVARILEHAAAAYTVVALTPEETMAVISATAVLGLSGGIIYDSLLIACARKVAAKRIYTFDIEHFRRAAPDLASVIVEP